jgi:hypothetical protein
MLVVTAPDLRAGQGYVRCGRCANVFNALVNLSEGSLPRAVGSDTAPVEPTAAIEPTAAVEAPTPPPAFDDIAVADIDEVPNYEPDIVEPVIADGELEFHPEKTSVADIFVDAPHEGSDIASGTFESIVLEGDPSDPTGTIEAAELAELPLPEPPAAAPAKPAPDPSPTLEFELDVETIARAEPVPSAPPPRPADDLNVLELLEQEGLTAPPPAPRVAADPLAASGVRKGLDIAPPEPVFPDAEAIAERFIERKQNERLHKLMLVGCVALAVLLLAQLVHQSRHTLAASETWGKPIRKLYGAFGVTLAPDWNVAAYDVRQLGAEAEPGDATRLVVRASVRNAATRAQPMPLLRLTLQDRYGKAIATRDLQPAEYLPEASRSLTELGADQRLDTEIRVVDTTRGAVGFEIDACLPSASGVLVCANDARRRAQTATR